MNNFVFVETAQVLRNSRGWPWYSELYTEPSFLLDC